MKTTMTRTFAPAALAAAALLAPASAAVGAAVPGPIEGTFTLSCPGFKVVLSAEGKIGVIGLPGDREKMIWPGLSVTVTNKSGESVSYTGAAGVTHIQYLDGGGQFVTATGPNLITVPRANGHPVGVFFTTGNVSWTLDSKGREVGDMFSGSGTVTDVCAALAG
ncbi:hypothetical protein [Pseudarthrobacter sp. L1SW]|jgi:hypothetical protein|uniref:hypothetical protein n=1 Tax=Pseudarthrobacter sp. L1SW TaxID=2851598 RepID=UPI001E3D6BDF|nr:hypothetical protein [Pseudarthrobacter sp. L1SW]UEL29531.1 hypothetical protein KTR40_05255 [Pseudarthrobacter sp. L1SW]